MFIITLTILNVYILVLGFDCPAYCFEPEIGCKRECMHINCPYSWKNCSIFNSCSEACKETLGNGNCDIKCNIKECEWDLYECQQEFTEKSVSCNIYDENCNMLYSIRDSLQGFEDHPERFLDYCDCPGVNDTNPQIIYVSDTPGNNTYIDLDSALVMGACCPYNSILLDKNIDVNHNYAPGQGIYSTLSYRQIIIASTDSQKQIHLQGPAHYVIQDDVTFRNIIIAADQFFESSTPNFVITNNGKLWFDQVQFKNKLNPLVYIYQGSLTISNSSFEGSLSSYDFIRTGNCVIHCMIEILDSNIINLDLSYSQFLTATWSDISIRNLNIENAVSRSSMFIISNSILDMNTLTVSNSIINSFMLLTNSLKITIENGNFDNIQYQDNLIKVKNTDNCNIIDMNFSSIFGNTKILNFQSTWAELQYIIFSNFNGIAIFSEINSKLTISYSDFSINANIQQSNITTAISSSYSLLNLSYSNITGFNNNPFSGIIISESIDQGMNYLDNLIIKDCNSVNGAGIFVCEANITITNSEFYNNTSPKKGGAIYIVDPRSSNWNITIAYNKFFGNSAKCGGAIYWNSFSIEEYDNIFEGNNGIYGQNKASSAMQLNVSGLNNLIFPGRVISACLNFTLIDYYNHPLPDQPGVVIVLSLVNASTSSSIIGSDFINSIHGIFSFCDLKIFGPPGSNQTIKATAYGEMDKTLLNPFTEVNISLEECNNGEVITGSMNQCMLCQSGSYSFFNNETQCHPCPDNANCSADQIIPIYGYWHSFNTSTKVIECVNPSSCPGNNQCATGYTGNICAACAKGYSLGSSNVCSRCPSTADNITLIVLISIAAIVIICYMIYRAFEDAYEPKLYHSVLIKILTNYIQLMMLTTILKMRWPEPFYQLINIQEEMSSSTGKIMSIDCLLQDYGSDTSYYISILMNFLMPLVIGLLITIIWSIVALCNSSFSLVVRPYITSLVVVFFLLHPGISITALSVFSCNEIENGQYWNSYSYNIQCYTGSYKNDYYALFVLTIVLWTIGMPMIAYIAIRINRSELEKPETKAKYGFLYHGYSNNRYYWEFVIMSRKIIIISVALVLRSSTASLQLIFVILILIGALSLNIIYSPFEVQELNKTESFSIGLSITCLTSGLMVEAGANYEWNVIFFVILIITNFLFFVYFLKRVYLAVGHYLWSSCPHVARTLCPRVQRPKIKIDEILRKEERRNSKKESSIAPRSGFVYDDTGVIIQLCHMRNFADFYSEVLAARFTLEDGEIGIPIENEFIRHDPMTPNPEVDAHHEVKESRPFYMKMFPKKAKRETVFDKIRKIRRMTIIEENAADNNEIENQGVEEGLARHSSMMSQYFSGE